MYRFHGLLKFLSAMAYNSIPDRIGKIESFTVSYQMINDPQAVQFVHKAALFSAELRHDMLTYVAEGGMTEIVAKTDGPGKVGIQMKAPADCSGYRGNMHDMLNAGTDVVILRAEKNLGFMLQPSEGVTVDDGSSIPEIPATAVLAAGIPALLQFFAAKLVAEFGFFFFHKILM
jgi:hypothetical protein